MATVKLLPKPPDYDNKNWEQGLFPQWVAMKLQIWDC